MALPAKNRIGKEKDLQAIFNKGKTVKGSFLFIKVANNKKGVPRFSFSIPKKIISKAVQRNRLKRLFSELATKYIKERKSKLSLDIVVVVRKKEKDDVLCRELDNILRSI